jgi:rhamnosyltransferase
MNLNQVDIFLPNVAVLLAAYNGVRYLKDQLMSIFAQEGVNVIIYVSVDKSNDGTEDFLIGLAKTEPRLKLLPFGMVFGSAGLNFYNLIKKVNFLSYEYVAYSDQDDLWHSHKLEHHIKLLNLSQADGVSSDVIAFWQNGTEKIVKKSQPQKTYDFIFESAGPGCSFLMTPLLVSKVYEQIVSKTSVAKDIVMHDWLTYAICRANGMKWIIDPTPSLMYRQHQNNVIGANVGIKPILARYEKIRQGWYRKEVRKVCAVCVGINQDQNLINLSNILVKKSFSSHLRLLPYVFQGRRKFIDKMLLAIMAIFSVF